MAEKNVDMGNKRRFTKNLVRFAKNPFGYAFWKRAHHNANSNPRYDHYEKLNKIELCMSGSLLRLLELSSITGTGPKLIKENVLG